MALIIQNTAQAKAYGDFLSHAQGVYQVTFNLYSRALTDDIGAHNIDAYIGSLKTMLNKMQTLTAVPGLASFAKAQESDPTYEPATEYAAVVAAADAVISWVYNNLPKDANGYELTYTRDLATGAKIPRVFTPAQTATFRTQLSNLLGTFNVVV